MGRIMSTEEEKTSLSEKSVSRDNIGTRTMPPPAPNNPFTAPAAAPAASERSFCIFNKKSPPVEVFSTGGVFIRD
jgi:hypothetical protein